MLSFSSRQRYFLFGAPTDMRKGFAGLSGLVRRHLDHELLGGDVFVFINRRRDRVKLLTWDTSLSPKLSGLFKYNFSIAKYSKTKRN